MDRRCCLPRRVTIPHPAVRPAAGLLPARQPDHPAAAGRAGGGRTIVHAAGVRQPTDPRRGASATSARRHHAAPEHRGRADQGAAGVLRVPRRPPPRGDPAGPIERTRHIEPFLTWAPHPALARHGPPAPAPSALRVSTKTWSTCALLRRHRRLGLGRSAPPRRLLFAGDIPRTARPLPRALAPDVDRALMAAVADLDDPFARTGLRCCAAPGCASANCSTSSWTACSTSPATAPGCGSRWASSAPNASSRSNPTPSQVLDGWTAQRGRATGAAAPPHRPADRLPVPRARPPPHRVSGCAGPADAVAAAGLRGRDGDSRCTSPHTSCGTPTAPPGQRRHGLQALMALLGHVTPEMTLRYATLASPDHPRRLRPGAWARSAPAT